MSVAILDTGSSPPSVSRLARARAAYWPLVPVLLGVGLLGLPTLAYPFGSDQAIFAAIADAINRGGFPYVDAWDQKPPGIYLLYAVALRLPGPLMQRVRVFDFMWTLATIAVLYELARSLWNVRAATCAALLYGVAYFTTQGYWYLAQPDGMAALPVLLALLLVRRPYGQGQTARFVFAGALAGAAFQLRFFAAPAVPIFALSGMPWPWRAWRQALAALLWLGVGFLAVQVALVTYLLAGDALREYIDATRFASHYATLGWPFAPEPRTFSRFLHHVQGSLLLFASAHFAMVMPAMALLFVALCLPGHEGARRLSLAALAAYAGILAQQKFFWYHWQLLLPFLALLAGCAWDAMYGFIEARAGRGVRGMVAASALTLGMVLATPWVTDFGYAAWDFYLHRDDSPAARARYYNQFGTYGEGAYSYLASAQVSDYVREQTTPEDRIYVFGYDPLVYLLSERQSASRFIYSLPFLSSWSPPRWYDELLADIDEHRPVYFIVQRNEGGARWITGQTQDTAAWVWKLSGLAGRLEHEYTLEIEIEDYALYRRRGR